jgi:ATP-dependent Clp protease ATP-binding subunit ClpA
VIALEVADLVLTASRTLGLDTGQVLDLLDPAAAEHALTQARPGSGPGDPATGAAVLLHALVRQRALREALHLGHTYIGTEHLLLSLLAGGDDITAQVLAGRGAGYDLARERVVALLTGRHEQADPKTRLVRLPVPAGLADVTEQLHQVQRQKTAAFEKGDLEGAAALRAREKQLRAEKLRLEQEWAAGVDVRTVIAENQRVHRELDRLRHLLRRHGIEPDGGTARTA